MVYGSKGGGGAPHFFLRDEKSMKKLLNWKNLRDMWLNISSATYDTKIETRGRVEHIKHCMSSGEIRPPLPSIRIILCVFVQKSQQQQQHISSTQRIYRHTQRLQRQFLIFIDETWQLSSVNDADDAHIFFFRLRCAVGLLWLCGARPPPFDPSTRWKRFDP